MHFSIHEIVLWPSRGSHAPRRITFREGAVNIITGQSGSGKSALLSIVDYCLGGGKCAIPVGVIRDAVSWFGVVVDTGSQYLVLARRNPGDQATTSDMYLNESTDPSIPTEPVKNYSVSEVKAYLDRLAGLPQYGFPESEHAPFRDRPSFRDTAAFQFQPQHIVANPHTLFFKADTTEHREKLKAVLPFVLGVVTADELQQAKRMRELERELGTREREYSMRRTALSALHNELQPLYSRAQELGLVSAGGTRASWTADRYLSELEAAVTASAERSVAQLPVGSTEAAVTELLALRVEEDRYAAAIATHRAHLGRMQRLRSLAQAYGNELGESTDRLNPEVLGWFADRIQSRVGCPVCGSQTETAEQEVTELKRLATEVSARAAALRSAPTVFDNEIEQTLRDLRENERQLSGIRSRMRSLEDESETVAKARQTTAAIQRFVGSVQQVVTSQSAVQDGSELVSDMAELQAEINELRQRISPEARRRRLAEAMRDLSTRMSAYAEILELEGSDREIELDLTELTILVRANGDRQDYLWEIGSGANWVGYHLCALLALHERFLEDAHSPVPNFMMIDQPSQVYFPETLAGGVGDEPSLSVDIQALHRIYRAMTDAVFRSGGRLQLIVTDHAGEDAWRGLDVHVVAEWRGSEEFLIPRAWYQ